ncbi:MAG: helix-turn-helix transcriptional regulator [Bacilli bacterium]|nr:helix-turn-helix transcriptional regulator [Bacilli bacterium]
MEFQDKLRLLRKEKGMSQEALAGELNVSRQAVSKWETGEGYPETEKLIMISDLFEVSLDYLMRDKTDIVSENVQQKYYMNTEKIEEYLHHKKVFARNIALSVSGIILSVNIPILLSLIGLENIGAFCLISSVALAVGVIIMTSIKHSDYAEIEEKEIIINSQDLEILRNEQMIFKSRFGMGIAIGVGMIILSTALVILIEEFMHNENFAAIQLLTSVAIAVYLFITLAIKDDGYKFLVQNELYIKEQKKENNSLFSVTMPLAAFAYLALGFIYNLWHPGWLIFPVTAVITGFIEKIRNKE